MLDALVEAVRGVASGERVMKDVEEIFSRDRWFTTPKFWETAGYAEKRLKQAGLKRVEVIGFPADGKTMFGSWKSGYAWDATEATLTVVRGKMKGRVLADYKKAPCSLGMWSAATPEGGVETELVDVGSGAREEDYAGKDVRGKIVMANAFGGAAKALAAKHGAVGILSDWNSQRENNPDAVGWHNGFADAQGGWPLTEGDELMFRFAVSPRVGDELRGMLKRGEKLRVKAVVEARIYEGEFPVVTGMIEGTTKEEVLILGHAFEQGAKDNASGVACMMEAVRVLAELIASGKLKKPRRGIRALVTNECFGTIGYVERFKERTKRTVAGINLDEVGIDKNTIPEVQALFANPQSCASYLDSFMEVVAEAVWKSPHFNPYVSAPFGMSDNLIALPGIGVPCVWIGCHGSRITWHNTTDVPAVMTEGQLKAAAVYAAVYLYFLADAGEKEAVWLAGVAGARGREALEKARIAAMGKSAELAKRAGYLLMVHEQAVGSVLRLAGGNGAKTAVARELRSLRKLAREMGKVPPLPKKQGKVRPVAAFVGPITYDTIPTAEREGHLDPRWGMAVNVVLAWGDGKRTVGEAVALAEMEMGRALPGVAEEILWLVGKGLVRDASVRG